METAPVLNLGFNNVPEYIDARSKQEALVRANPYVEIIDNATFEIAKKRRTALRQGRYDLQNGEKTIAAKLKEFREVVKSETSSLIEITLQHENKQQSEIDRYDAEKKKEREERARRERERILKIESDIKLFKAQNHQLIEKATLNTIDGIIADVKAQELVCDEFEDKFNEVKSEVLSAAALRKDQLDEAEKLKIEREKMEAERKAIEAERKAQEKKAREEREALARKAKEEREKLEAERKAQDDKLKKEREELEVKRQHLAKIEAERKAKEEAERKAAEAAERKAKEELEKKAKEEAERKRQEALKPDKEKLLRVVRSLSIDIDPSVKFQSKEAERLSEQYVEDADELIKKYVNLVNNL